MASNLYRLALATLGEDARASFADLEHWMEDFMTADSGRPIRGGGVLANLREESHLPGDSLFGEAAEMAAFISRVLEGCAGTADDERHAGYAAACAESAGRGLAIAREHLPEELLRYVRGTRLVRRLVEALLGEGALSDLDRGTISLESTFSRLAGNWNASRLDETDFLGPRKTRMVFATFEHPAGAPRGDAGALAQALALPVVPRREEVLVELSYATDAVTDHRFPTVADAGWCHEFQPSTEVPPNAAEPRSCCGWTRPLGDQPPQPELVHRNASLRIVAKPPRLVGRFTP